jgi:hypothetical protein
MIDTRRALAAGVLCALAGCSGGGGTAPSPPSPRAALADGKLVLAIPVGQTSDARHRHFLSPSASSVTIAVTGIAPPVVADVSATSAQCATTGTTRSCSIPLAAPVGQDTFTATLYAGPAATGAVLGSGSTAQQIAAGALFGLTVAVDGEVSSIELSAARAQFTAGVAASTTLTVGALDAGNNIILGSYAFPITLTDSDTTGTFAISPTVVTGSSTIVTLTYSGGTGATNATISANATNVPLSSVSAQIVSISGTTPTPSPTPTPKPTATPTNTPTPTPTPTPPGGGPYLYAADLGNATMTVTSTSANGNVAPVRTLGGTQTGISQDYDLAIDAGGLAYISDLRDPEITVYPKGATGNVAPIRTIAGAGTGLSGPLGVAFDSTGNLVVANFFNETITVYAPGANGDATPIRTISGAATQISLPYGLALDAANDIYLVDDTSQEGGTDSLTVYASGANGNAAPIRTISGGNTGMSGAVYDAVDKQGYVYVTNVNAESVTIFGPTQNGNVVPSRTIAGSLTTFDGPTGIAVDSNGLIYVGNQGSNAILVFAAGANGNVAPIRTIEGGNTGLSAPEGMQIAP